MRIFFIFFTLGIVSACQLKNASDKKPNRPLIVEKHELPKVLEETSGLAILNDTLWTVNDSGNEATLYAISTKGKLLAKRLTTNTNIDWEDMANANGRLIVADMGNNFGTRKNLYLLEVDLSNGTATTLDSIPFHYPEQENFGFQQATAFDAESIIYVENQLVVFTKNRSTLTTELYVVSKTTKAAKKIGALPVGALITGADYQQESKTLVLTAYNTNKKQYVYVVNDFSLSAIADAKIKQYELDFKGAQIEAVSIIDSNTFWITSEETNKYNAFLAKITIQ